MRAARRQGRGDGSDATRARRRELGHSSEVMAADREDGSKRRVQQGEGREARAARRGQRGQRGEGSEDRRAKEARRWQRGEAAPSRRRAMGSDGQPEGAEMAKSADFLPVLRADCSLEHKSG